MGIVYHGSKMHNLKRLEPRDNKHGTYLYATKDKTWALIFTRRCGGFSTFRLGRLGNDGPWELVENIPGAFKKMYSNGVSIYTLPDDTFKEVKNGVNEVVSDVAVDVIEEEYIDCALDALLEYEKQGLVKLYEYPNLPNDYESESFYIIGKIREFKTVYNEDFNKSTYDELVCLHPKILGDINKIAQEFGYNYHYEPNDLVDIFRSRIEKQLNNLDVEKFIDNSYISINEAYPSLKTSIDKLYEEYKCALENKKDTTKVK